MCVCLSSVDCVNKRTPSIIHILKPLKMIRYNIESTIAVAGRPVGWCWLYYRDDVQSLWCCGSTGRWPSSRALHFHMMWSIGRRRVASASLDSSRSTFVTSFTNWSSRQSTIGCKLKDRNDLPFKEIRENAYRIGSMAKWDSLIRLLFVCVCYVWCYTWCVYICSKYLYSCRFQVKK